MRCTVTGEPYTIFGYGGKQVRDNIHSKDVVAAFTAFHNNPKVAAVYNLGGGRASNCSMLEAISMCEGVARRQLNYELSDSARTGDHHWWISDTSDFEADYPGWSVTVGVRDVLEEIYEANVESWTSAAAAVALGDQGRETVRMAARSVGFLGSRRSARR